MSTEHDFLAVAVSLGYLDAEKAEMIKTTWKQSQRGSGGKASMVELLASEIPKEYLEKITSYVRKNTFLCPHCEAQYSTISHVPGSKFPCGNCNRMVTVPRYSHAAPPGEVSVPLSDESVQSPAVVAPSMVEPQAGSSASSKMKNAGPLTGIVVRGYKIGELIKSGGQGSVYLAYRGDIRRHAAVKVLHQEEEKTLQRFKSEAEAMANSEHPNIVPIYDWVRERIKGPEGERAYHFIIMQYLDGGSLRSLLEQKGCLFWEEAVKITLKVANALAFAHKKGIVHRDIKPDNILLSHKGEVKVSDFGISKSLSEDSMALTTRGEILGTFQYLSPEQARDEQLDHRTDLYSLGVVLYAMVTGRQPYPGTGYTPIASLTDPKTEPPPARDLVRNLPEWVDQLVLDMMRKDRNRRIESASEVMRRIADSFHGGSAELDQDLTVFRADRFHGRDVRTLARIVARLPLLLLPLPLLFLLLGLARNAWNPAYLRDGWGTAEGAREIWCLLWDGAEAKARKITDALAKQIESLLVKLADPVELGRKVLEAADLGADRNVCEEIKTSLEKYFDKDLAPRSSVPAIREILEAARKQVVQAGLPPSWIGRTDAEISKQEEMLRCSVETHTQLERFEMLMKGIIDFKPGPGGIPSSCKGLQAEDQATCVKAVMPRVRQYVDLNFVNAPLILQKLLADLGTVELKDPELMDHEAELLNCAVEKLVNTSKAATTVALEDLPDNLEKIVSSKGKLENVLKEPRYEKHSGLMEWVLQEQRIMLETIWLTTVETFAEQLGKGLATEDTWKCANDISKSVSEFNELAEALKDCRSAWDPPKNPNFGLLPEVGNVLKSRRDLRESIVKLFVPESLVAGQVNPRIKNLLVIVEKLIAQKEERVQGNLTQLLEQKPADANTSAGNRYYLKALKKVQGLRARREDSNKLVADLCAFADQINEGLRGDPGQKLPWEELLRYGADAFNTVVEGRTDLKISVPNETKRLLRNACGDVGVPPETTEKFVEIVDSFGER